MKEQNSKNISLQHFAFAARNNSKKKVLSFLNWACKIVSPQNKKGLQSFKNLLCFNFNSYKNNALLLMFYGTNILSLTYRIVTKLYTKHPNFYANRAVTLQYIWKLDAAPCSAGECCSEMHKHILWIYFLSACTFSDLYESLKLIFCCMQMTAFLVD